MAALLERCPQAISRRDLVAGSSLQLLGERGDGFPRRFELDEVGWLDSNWLLVGVRK